MLALETIHTLEQSKLQLGNNMKPFNLQAAIAGAPIQATCGTSLKFIAYVKEAKLLHERIITLAPWGSILFYREDTEELVMATVVKTYWFNVHRRFITGELFCSHSFDNEAEAMRDARLTGGYIKTVSFEIEE
jgi:hypothetical protein